MIHVSIINNTENKEFEHSEGPLEIGRGPAKSAVRCVLSDPFVSRDQLRLEELADGRLRVENLSQNKPVTLADGRVLETGGGCELDLPVQIRAGQTYIRIWSPDAPLSRAAPTVVAAPIAWRGSKPRPLQMLGESPDAETLAHWFETVITVQQAAAGSAEFFHETARAVVDLVGLDRGLVLLRSGDLWQIAGMYATGELSGRSYSRGIVEEVRRRRRTIFQNMGEAAASESLANIEALVAAPMLNRNQEVVGIVYGSRNRGVGNGSPEIRPLEAQIVQVLAAAAGAGLARQQQEAEALRSQILFEQFFSPQLARELARDAGLLEGRQREVTVLFSDLRNFSHISEQLGPREMFRLMQDVMELQSSRIRELDGVVVDYYGDGLLAMWNAPTDQPDHAARACRAALAIVQGLPKVNQTWRSVLDQPLDLGIGLNTGQALVGNTGSRVKFKYGPMGPAVNLANRVEGATKKLGVSILITGATQALLDESFATRRLCRARLAGVSKPIDLHQLHVELRSDAWRQQRDAYESALAHFEAGRWAEACQAIYPLLSDSEGRFDAASLHLLSRAVECLKSRPELFDPVMDFRAK